MSHGSSQGDVPFTLILEQDRENVSGSVSSPMGSAAITSGSFKKKNLEIHIDTSQGNYLLTGKFAKRQLRGEWSHDKDERGTWESKKPATSHSKS